MMKRKTKSTLTPRLRFPEFREPWKEKAISEMLEERSRPIDLQPDKEYALVTVKRRYGGVVPREVLKGKEVLVKSQFVVRPNDFLISKRQIVHNACGVVPTELDQSVVSNEYSVLTAKEDCDIEFFNYFSQQPSVSKSFMHSSVGIVIEKMLFKLNVWLKLKFAFPYPAEQRKIATCLGSLDEWIGAESAKLEALRLHKKGLMQQLFPRPGESRPRLRFPEFHNAGEWETEKLGKFVDIWSGDSPSQYVLSPEGKYPFVKVEDLNNCAKYQSTGREFCDDANGVVPSQSILFPKRGAAIENNKIRVTATEILIDTNLMAIKPKDGLATEFLFYYLSNVGLAHIADTSTIPQINNKHIIPFEILLPPTAEQQQIAACLSSLDAVLSAQSQKVAGLKQHKKGLMQQLFPSAEG